MEMECVGDQNEIHSFSNQARKAKTVAVHSNYELIRLMSKCRPPPSITTNATTMTENRNRKMNTSTHYAIAHTLKVFEFEHSLQMNIKQKEKGGRSGDEDMVLTNAVLTPVIFIRIYTIHKIKRNTDQNKNILYSVTSHQFSVTSTLFS